MKKVFIYKGIHAESDSVELELKNALKNNNVEVSNKIDTSTDLIFIIGGDGSFLKFIQEYEFPTIPLCGINIGHVGFFQEVDRTEINEFVTCFTDNKYTIQPYNIVKGTFKTNNNTITYHALNEFVIRSCTNNLVHLNISINNSFIESFSGDGILVSSPAGSTAYNYSLSGALVDPRLNLLQVTPMAPMNTKVYRSLTSSILLPKDDSLIIKPIDERSKKLQILFDGEDMVISDISEIILTLSNRKINLVRFKNTTFWDKVKDKFL